MSNGKRRVIYEDNVKQLLRSIKRDYDHGVYGSNLFVIDAVKEALNYAEGSLAGLKTAEEEPVRRGKWKWDLASNGWADHICSECGFRENTDIHVTLTWGWCPKCGAKMDKER